MDSDFGKLAGIFLGGCIGLGLAGIVRSTVLEYRTLPAPQQQGPICPDPEQGVFQIGGLPRCGPCIAGLTLNTGDWCGELWGKPGKWSWLPAEHRDYPEHRDAGR